MCALSFDFVHLIHMLPIPIATVIYIGMCSHMLYVPIAYCFELILYIYSYMLLALHISRTLPADMYMMLCAIPPCVSSVDLVEVHRLWLAYIHAHYPHANLCTCLLYHFFLHMLTTFSCLLPLCLFPLHVYDHTSNELMWFLLMIKVFSIGIHSLNRELPLFT